MTIYYTGRGDGGKSEMGPKKIAKDDPLFEVLGALDELSSWIGVCQYKPLKQIQEDLFIAQAEIGMKAMGRRYTIRVTRSMTERLEREIMAIDKIVPQIKKFIIPGASELSAKLDYARALARRAERALVKASEANEAISSSALLPYLNRLSSILFAHARLVNYKLKIKERNPSYK